jgi:hypothetical protein
MQKLIVFMVFFVSKSCAQTGSLNYEFLDWFVTTLEQKSNYIDKWPDNINAYDLGTDTRAAIRGCGNPIVYSQSVMTALKNLETDYDTLSLVKQVRNSHGHPFSQDGFKNAKVISWTRLSPYDHSFYGRLFIPFKHKRTITLSIPLWTGNNKYAIVKSSVLDRMSREINSSIDIFQRQPDSSFKLVKRLDRLR